MALFIKQMLEQRMLRSIAKAVIATVIGIGLGIIISEWTNNETGEVLSTFSIVTKKASNVLKNVSHINIYRLAQTDVPQNSVIAYPLKQQKSLYQLLPKN